MKSVNDWKEYQILDMADGKKLESWNQIILVRPDPQIIWTDKTNPSLWQKVSARYERSNTGGGFWNILNPKMKEEWQITYQDLVFNLKLMGFKHTGLFPEQAYNWNYIREKIRTSNRTVKVLNLFAYTGAASIAALKEGAEVVHVDASRGMIDWAKENVKTNHLEDKPIRFLVDDVIKFVKREIRRGNKYDAIIMDPPSYGRGPSGEMWKLEDNLADFVELCKKVLSNKPLFVLINSYTTGLQPTVIANILKSVFGNENVEADEIGLPSEEGLVLPCGATGVKIWKN